MKIQNQKLFQNKCYIDGNWIDSNNKQTIAVNNPASLEIIGNVPKCGTDETKLAIEAANNALPDWKAKTAKERSILLRKWFDLIILNQEDLANIMTIEQGKPINESRGEIGYGASFIELYAEEGKRVYGETIPDTLPDRRIVVIKQPIGVVAAITPWNFPSSMITRKCAPALAVGCPVVIKPASQTPYSALALGVLAEEAGFPKGVINILTGSAKEIGSELTSNPNVRKVSFTGSTEVGKILLAQCASTVKKVSMELGGHAPFIAFDDCDVNQAVLGAMQSKFRNTGQTCVCANRLFVHDKIYDEFLDKFTKQVKNIKVGNGLDENVTSGPLIDQYSLKKVQEHVQDAVNIGSKIAVGGDIHSLGGNFYQPTILYNVTSKAKITYQETFGPVASIIRISDLDEAIDIINASNFRLAGAISTTSRDSAVRLHDSIQVGQFSWNGPPGYRTEEAPFGGFGDSGNGEKEGVVMMTRAMRRIRTVYEHI